MRLICPLCGSRDSREFSYLGDAKLMDRPDARAPFEDWHEYVHLRDNPEGVHKELWLHDYGCRAYLQVTRNTATHEVLEVVTVDSLKAEATS